MHCKNQQEKSFEPCAKTSEKTIERSRRKRRAKRARKPMKIRTMIDTAVGSEAVVIILRLVDGEAAGREAEIDTARNLRQTAIHMRARTTNTVALDVIGVT